MFKQLIKYFFILFVMINFLGLQIQASNIPEEKALKFLFMEHQLIAKYNYPKLNDNDFSIDVNRLNKSQLLRYIRALRYNGLFDVLIDDKIIESKKAEFHALLDEQSEEFATWLEDEKKANRLRNIVAAKGIWRNIDMLIDTSINIAAVSGVAQLAKAKKLPKFISTLNSALKKSKLLKAVDTLNSYPMTVAVTLIKSGKFIASEKSPEETVKEFQSLGIFLVKTGEELLIPKSQKNKLLMYIANTINEVSMSIISGSFTALWVKADREIYLNILKSLQGFIPIYGSFYEQYNTVSDYLNEPTNEQAINAVKLHFINKKHRKQLDDFYHEQFISYIKDAVDTIKNYNFKMYFVDVRPNDWFFPYITELAKKGYINTKNAKFHPNPPEGFILRYEIVAMLNSILFKNDFNKFTDVPNYSNHITKTYAFMKYKIGEVNNINEENFTDKLTRNEMAEIVTKYTIKSLGISLNTVIKNINNITKNFSCCGHEFKISKYVTKENGWNEYSSFLNNLNISSGKTDKRYHGEDYITRAEVAVMLYKMYLAKQLLK
jgi:hypothetical protein